MNLADFWGGFLFFSFMCALLCVGGVLALKRSGNETHGGRRLLIGGGLLLGKQLLAVLFLFSFFRFLSPAVFVAGALLGLGCIVLGLGVFFCGGIQTAESSICLRALRLTRRSSRLQRSMETKS